MLEGLLAEPETISYYALLQVDPVLKMGMGFRGGDPYHDALGRFTTPLGAVAHPVSHEENVAMGRAKPRSVAEAVEAGVPPPLNPFGHAAAEFHDGDYVYTFRADREEPLLFGRVVGRRRGERAYGRVRVHTRLGYSTHPVHEVAPAEELERYARDNDDLVAWHVYHWGPGERYRYGLHEYNARRQELSWRPPEVLPPEDLAREYTRLLDLEREGKASLPQRIYLGLIEAQFRDRHLPLPKPEEWRQFEEELSRHPVEALTREDLIAEHARLRRLVHEDRATLPQRTRLRMLENELRARHIPIPRRIETEEPARIDQTLAHELANLREPETIYRMDPDDPIEPYLPFIQSHLNKAFSSPDFTIEHLVSGKDSDRIEELQNKAAQQEMFIRQKINKHLEAGGLTTEDDRLLQGMHFMISALKNTKAYANRTPVPYNHHVLVALKNGDPVAALNFHHVGEETTKVGLLGSSQEHPGAATALQWALANWAHEHEEGVESEATPSAEPYHAKIGRILDHGYSFWTPEDVAKIAELRPERHPE